MEFLVEFEVSVPEGTSEREVQERLNAEATAAAALVEQGQLVRVWRLHTPDGASNILGVYRADDEDQLDRLLRALPLFGWMRLVVTALEPHPNDPATPPVVASGTG